MSNEQTTSGRPATVFLNRPLWHWPEVAAAVGAPVPAGGPEVTGVSIDSRSLKAGDLFIALAGDPGERFFTSSPGTRDGHEFLQDAQAQGAAGALVAQTQPLACAQIRVEDTLDGLWSLGRAAVKRHQGRRIAITGSSGKTTAKGFLGAALDAQVEAGSLNNFWGVPLCLARTPMAARHGVYEIGTRQEGEIEPLSLLVQPHVAVLLNVHPAHIGNFPSFEALRKEKLSISKGLENISRFVCEYSVAQSAGIEERVISFGDARGSTVRLTEQAGDRACYDSPQGRLTARVPGGGRHRALTLGAVIGTLVALDEDLQLALDLPATLVPDGRGNEHLIPRAGGGAWTLIDDSYNANPASMAAALDALGEHQQDAQTAETAAYAVIGEMLELGDNSAAYHQQLIEHCQPLAGVFCVGSGTRELFEALPKTQQLGYAERASDIDLRALVGPLPKSGRLLVKGSNRVFWQHRFVDSLARAFADTPPS